MQNFQQTLNISWDLPISKLPLMDFIRMPFTYRSTYNYLGTTRALASQGSVINNNTIMNLTTQANFQTLYNKSKLLKKAYAQKPAKKNNINRKGKDADKDKNEVDKKRGIDQRKADAARADSLRKADMQERLRELGYFGLRFVTGVKNITLQYNNTFSSSIAGYMGEARIVGLDPSNQWNPGLGFVFGIPDGDSFKTSRGNIGGDVIETLLRDDLLSHDTLMNTPCTGNQNNMISFQSTIEPLRDCRIEINATRNYSRQQEAYYKYSNASGMVEGPLSYIMTGTYTTTAWSFKTIFRNGDELFNQFLEARSIVANRLADMNPDPYNDVMVQDTMNGLYYPAGYSANQQSVLLTAFLATYTGKDPSKIGFTPFMNLPLPNWKLSYNGLGKIDFLKKWFTNISITHGYTSTYSIGNFYTDAAISALTEGYDYGTETVVNNNGDYIAPVSMEGVMINEQFNPLIMISVNMVNSFQFKLSIQKSRSLNLSFSNNQLTENYRDGITFGTGYRFKDLEIHVKTGDRTHDLKNDLVLQANITYNNNLTQIRKINQGFSQISSGSKVWMAEISAEYALSSTLTLRAFFQTNINRPYITNAYPNSTTKGGVTVRFSF